jgi:hypothetical protein
VTALETADAVVVPTELAGVRVAEWIDAPVELELVEAGAAVFPVPPATTVTALAGAWAVADVEFPAAAAALPVPAPAITVTPL